MKIFPSANDASSAPQAPFGFVLRRDGHLTLVFAAIVAVHYLLGWW